MVYHGVGQGFTIYEDGTRIRADQDKTNVMIPRGNGLVSIGKRYAQGQHKYATASVDEIKMYNRQLTQQEICDMY